MSIGDEVNIIHFLNCELTKWSPSDEDKVQSVPKCFNIASLVMKTSIESKSIKKKKQSLLFHNEMMVKSIF
jgi:hypothetical protein